MQISGHGKADQLAKLLLGAPETEGVSAKQSVPSRAAGKDQVHISGQAKELQRIQALTNEPDQARSERINHIKQGIESGTYGVSNRAVGDAMIKQALTDSVV